MARWTSSEWSQPDRVVLTRYAREWTQLWNLVIRRGDMDSETLRSTNGCVGAGEQSWIIDRSMRAGDSESVGRDLFLPCVPFRYTF